MEQPDRITMSVEEPDIDKEEETVDGSVETKYKVEKETLSEECPEKLGDTLLWQICGKCSGLIPFACPCIDCTAAPSGSKGRLCHYCATNTVDPYRLKEWVYEPSNPIEPITTWGRIDIYTNQLKEYPKYSDVYYGIYLELFNYINHDDVIAAIYESLKVKRSYGMVQYSRDVISQIQHICSVSGGRDFVLVNSDVLLSVYRKWYPIYKQLNPKS